MASPAIWTMRRPPTTAFTALMTVSTVLMSAKQSPDGSNDNSDGSDDGSDVSKGTPDSDIKSLWSLIRLETYSRRGRLHTWSNFWQTMSRSQFGARATYHLCGYIQNGTRTSTTAPTQNTQQATTLEAGGPTAAAVLYTKKQGERREQARERGGRATTDRHRNGGGRGTAATTYAYKNLT